MEFPDDIAPPWRFANDYTSVQIYTMGLIVLIVLQQF